MSVEEFEKTLYLIDTEYDDALKTMIKNKSSYLKYDLFSKLSDWSSENEYRIDYDFRNNSTLIRELQQPLIVEEDWGKMGRELSTSGFIGFLNM